MHKLIGLLARLTALVGGIVLIALIVLTTVSILGRTLATLLNSATVERIAAGAAQSLRDLGIGEINGSYELLEAGVAFAIFSFLPLAQFYGAHATVDVFTSFLPRRANRWIAAFWEVVLCAVILLLIAQLYGGMERYIRNGQTTLFLQFPVWWAFALSFAAGVIACITAIYCAVVRVLEALRDTNILPSEHGGS
ncbi:MAG: TRAP transporter small permease [Pseudomonadota bacterium]